MVHSCYQEPPKMFDLGNCTRTGISILTSVADQQKNLVLCIFLQNRNYVFLSSTYFFPIENCTQKGQATRAKKCKFYALWHHFKSRAKKLYFCHLVFLSLANFFPIKNCVGKDFFAWIKVKSIFYREKK